MDFLVTVVFVFFVNVTKTVVSV